jgi:fructose-bisphosphate aldolase class II
MKTLRQSLDDARERRVAVGHFNVSELVAFRAVTGTARELGVPVLVGVSEGEREFIGVREIRALVATIREAHGQAVYLNADHTHSIPAAEEAARAGFDEVLFDASSATFEENVAQTRRAVEAIKSIDDRIVVEGEIGWIGASSEIHERAPEGLEQGLTTPQQAREFVAATRVDVLAPAVGNMHGLLESMGRGESQKRLDIDRIRGIRQATGALLTLHGGSGTDDRDLAVAIDAGITIVHINTELRLALRRGLEAALARDLVTLAPYKLLLEPVRAIEQVVRSRLELFQGPLARNSGLGL